MPNKPKKARIMLVDDEQDITTVLKAGLEKHGYSVDAFNDPNEALSQFKPRQYQGIILDIRMPEMNGFELGQAIWDKDPAAQITFMTAFEMYRQEADKVLRNFDRYRFVKKPISIKTLAEHVQKRLLKA